MNVIPNWRPQATFLHYTALYVGLYGVLREIPNLAYEAFVRGYLSDLEKYPTSTLQRHRIIWVREWLAQLPPSGPVEETLGVTPFGP